MRFLIRVAYDGTNYCGWQLQPELPTIEGELNKALSSLTGENIEVIGASRTDAGVHSDGSVAVFDSATRIPPEKIKYAVNNLLPEDIVVTQSFEVPESFHPRHTDCVKTYQYRILNTEYPDPNRRYNSYHYRGKLDTELMNEAGKYIVGEHDFRCFMASGSQVTDTVRTIYALNVSKEKDMIVITVTGNGFLYNMVRIIAGTLIEVGRGKKNPGDLEKIIASKDRNEAGNTAVAKGLTLHKIVYPELGEKI